MTRPSTSTVATTGPAGSSTSPEASCASASATTWSTSASGTSAGARTAMVAPTGAELSVPAMMRRTTPAAGASSVPTILSVSISASPAPSWTSSPSSTSHSVILPAVIDSPHLGIVTLAILASAMARSALPPGHGLGRVDDLLGVRDVGILERVGERHRRVGRRHHLDRGPQRPERLLGHGGRDVGGQVAARRGLVHHHQPAGALHALQDRLGVQRAGRAR